MSGNQQIVTTDRGTLSLKFCPDLSGVGSCIVVECQHLEARSKCLDGVAILNRPGRLRLLR